MEPISNKSLIKYKLALILAVFFWGSAFVGIRAGLQAYPPGSFALLRFLVASIFVIFFYIRLPERASLTGPERLLAIMTGVLGIGLYSIVLNYGEVQVPAGNTSFIVSQSPLVSTLFAVIFLGERIGWLGIMGFMVSFCGVLLIAVSEAHGFVLDAGLILVLLAMLLGSSYSVMQKPLLHKLHAAQFAAIAIWAGTATMLIFSHELLTSLSTASWHGTAWGIYLGIFPSTLGFVLWSYGLAKMPASQAVSYLYWMPLVATGLGWLCLGEVPTVGVIMGGIIAIIGSIIVNRAKIVAATRKEVV